MDVSPDFKRVALGNNNSEVRVVDAATFEDVLPPLKRERKFVSAVRFSPDGRYLVSRAASSTKGIGGFGGTIQWWDMTTGQAVRKDPVVYTGKDFFSGYHDAQFSSDGRLLALAGATIGNLGLMSEVHVFDLATGEKVGGLPPNSNGHAHGLAFSPDGRLLAVQTMHFPIEGGDLTVWDWQRREAVLPPIPLVGWPRGCQFDPATGYLASASGSLVQVYDVNAGKLLFSLSHPADVFALRFSRPGKTILTRTNEEVYLWDARTGEPLRAPIKPPASVEDAALTPDGKFLIALSNRFADRNIRVWNLSADANQMEADKRLAQLISGQRVDGETSVPLSPEEMEADWRFLHERQPNKLRSSNEMLQQWYDRQSSLQLDRSNWLTAAEQLDALNHLQPDNIWWHYQAGFCRLATGDIEHVRATCREMLRRCPRTGEDLPSVDQTVKLGLLLPDILPDPKPAIELSELLEKAKPDQQHYHWFALSRGIALYRAGRWNESAQKLEKVCSMSKLPGLCDTMAKLFLAMDRVQQKRPDEAKTLLTEAEGEIAAAEKDPSQYPSISRAQCRAVLPEVQRVVQMKAP
jgi:WD40 repeat protein